MYQPGRFFHACNGMIRGKFLGGPESYNLRVEEGQKAASLIENAAKELGADRVLAPNPGSTNRFCDVDGPGLYSLRLNGRDIFRSVEPADAGIARDNKTAIMFSNADCWLGIVLDPKSNWWSLVHLSGECLTQRKTVLHRVVTAAPVRPKGLVFLAGFGIGRCCYGYDQRSPKLDRWRHFYPSAVGGYVTTGPRTGQTAVDIFTAVKIVVEEIGFGQVFFFNTCTACFQHPVLGGRAFHSNTYDQAGSGGPRNCLIAVRSYCGELPIPLEELGRN